MDIGADLSGIAGLKVDGMVTKEGFARPASSASEMPPPPITKKRKAAPASSSAKRVQIGEDLPDELDEGEIKDMLDQADDVHIEALNEGALKRMVLQLERKIKNNQELRIKFSDDPDKFLKSEVDLDEAIKKFTQLSTHPDLYDELVKLDALPMLLGILNHANTDIAVDVFEVLNELTDADVIAEVEDSEAFLKALFDAQLPDMTVEVLLRLNEDASDEEFTAVTNGLSMIENLADINPKETCRHFVGISKFLTWLLKRVRAPKMDHNRLHASEILGIMLQNSETAVDSLVKLEGIDKLLRGISEYRKKEPADSEESEFVENMFDCLCTLMLLDTHQVAFGKMQGLELMIRMMRAHNFASTPALKLANHAMRNCSANCQIFVDKMGLKVLFALFMKKGAGQKTKSVARECEEHITSIINSLCRYCTATPVARVLNKFTEFKFEKLERLLEMHEEYFLAVKEADRQRHQGLVEKIDREFEVDEEEQLFLDRCDAGLFTLQQVDCIILRLGNMGNRQVGEELVKLLDTKGVDLGEMISIVLEYCVHLDASAKPESDELHKFLRNFAKNAGRMHMLDDALKALEEVPAASAPA
mmetsp:Transcript_13275/g.30210  ORF Transcript_13275/g.30210 Transcript_13275/m.30210 type:complete len:590 (+) Transcript_13275:133-1902(+)